MQFHNVIVGDKPAWQDDEGIIFTEFIGGLAWPRNTAPGFILVLGQQWHDGHGWPTLRLLYESYQHIDKFPEFMASLQDQFYVDRWICDWKKENEAYVDFIEEWADRRNKRNPTRKILFNFEQSSLPPDFSLVVARLNRRFSENALSLAKNGILVERVRALLQENPEEDKLDEKYYEIKALSTVVFEFDTTVDVSGSKYVRPTEPPSAMAV